MNPRRSRRMRWKKRILREEEEEDEDPGDEGHPGCSATPTTWLPCCSCPTTSQISSSSSPSHPCQQRCSSSSPSSPSFLSLSPSSSPSHSFLLFLLLATSAVAQQPQQCPSLQPPCRCAPSIYEPVAIICENAGSLQNALQAAQAAKQQPVSCEELRGNRELRCPGMG